MIVSFTTKESVQPDRTERVPVYGDVLGSELAQTQAHSLPRRTRHVLLLFCPSTILPGFFDSRGFLPPFYKHR